MARRRPGADLPRAGAGTGRQRRGRPRARAPAAAAGAAARGAAIRRPARARGQAPQRKDRLYQWLPPFEEKGGEGPLREQHAHERPSLLARHADDLLPRDERHGHDGQHGRSRREPGRADPALHAGAVPHRRPGGEPGQPGGVRAPAAAAAQRGGGGGRGGAGGGGGPVLVSPDKTSVYYQGTLNDKNPEQVGPKTFVDRVAIKTGEKKRLFESDNKDVYESVTTVLDPEAGRFVIERQSPTQVPQFFLVDGSTPQAADREQGPVPGPDQRAEAAHHGRARRRDQVPGQRDAAAGLPEGHAGCRRSSGSTRASSPNQEAIDRPDRTFNKNSFQNFGTRSMQFFVRLGYAVVVDTPGAHPDRRAHRPAEQQLRERPAEQPVGDDRRTRSPGDRRPHAAGDRRPQLRRVHDGQRDGAHAVLQGRHRGRRRLQPHADAARVPERAARPLGGAERLPRDVAVPLREQPDRARC